MNNRIKLLVLAFLLNFLSIVNSQNLKFKHYTIDEGLSQSVVNCVYQDKDGYIWVGTQNGLNKFNGYDFVNYVHNPNDTNSISDNWVYDIKEDSNGNIYIATRDGLNILNKKTGKFTYYVPPEIIKHRFIVYGIVFYNSEILYLNTHSNLYKFNIKNSSFTKYKNDVGSDAQTFNKSFRIIKDSDGLIWQSTNNGLYTFDIKTEKFNVFKSNETDNNSISNNSVFEVYEDSKKNIWIGTLNGLNIYNKKTKKFRKFFYNPNKENTISHNSIRAVIEDKKGILWIATEGGGLNKLSFDKNNKAVFKSYKHSDANQNSLMLDILASLLLDKSNVLWVGTLSGIDKVNLKEKKFKLYQRNTEINSIPLRDNIIASLFKEGKDIIWVGNWGKGLNIYNRKTKKIRYFSSEFEGKDYISNDFVHYIFKDSKNRMWIGTRDGISIFDKQKDRFVSFKEYFNSETFPDFPNIRIYKIIEDSHNNIWIASKNGLYILDMKNKNYERIYNNKKNSNYISDNLIYEIYEDSKKNMWIGTQNGLDFFDYKTKKISHYKRNSKSTNTLINNFIISICEDQNNDIWICTESGVNRFNIKDSLFIFYKDKGLSANVVYEVLKDKNNDLWFGSGYGLSKYIKKDDKFKTYTIDDGLQSMEFNLNACFASNDGEMLFGGIKGFNSFHPDSLNENKFVPNVVITKIEKLINNKQQNIFISSLKEYFFEYSDNSFTVEFAALEYTNPQKNRYAYTLLKNRGVKQKTKWIDIGTRRFVSLSGLAPGEYIFKVKACNNDGIWNNKGTSVFLTIHPPLWKTIPAYILYIVIIVVSIFFFIKLREKKLIKEKELLENKVTERTKELAKQKEKIETAYKNIKQLSSIGQKITANISTVRIIDIVYQNINKLMDASVFAIGIFNANENRLEFDGAKENGETLPFYYYELSNENAPAIICFKQKKEIALSSVEEYQKLAKQNAIVGNLPESLIYLPLIKNKKAIGVLTIQSFNKNSYKEVHINILRNIAIYTTIALDNADAFSKIEKQKEDIQYKNISLQQKTEEILAQRDEIEEQRDIATNQRDKIVKQNIAITDSIYYAKRIQKAVLPSKRILKNCFTDFFILFKPRDIVSGDFYWMKEVDNKLVVVVADCTGHGVPGAFLSILGISILKEVIQKDKIYKANSILEELRNKVKLALGQTGERNEQKDGMDISLCIIDKDNNKVQFAGANNSLYLIRDNEINITKGDKNPIGIYLNERPFTNHEISFQKNDSIYLFSDGYIDQFGGDRGLKFMSKRFKPLLLKIYKDDMKQQSQILENEFDKWRANYKQIDDILILGVRL